MSRCNIELKRLSRTLGQISPPAKSNNRHLCVATMFTLSAVGTAQAVDFVKADNTIALNLPTSYNPTGGPPGALDRIVVNSVMASSRTSSLGGNLSIDGIVVGSSATRTLSINGSNSLTLGASGIAFQSGTTGGLVFNGPAITVGTNQTWDFAGRGATFNGATSYANTSSLIITGTGGQLFFHNGTTTLDAQLTGATSVTLDSSPSAADLTLTNSTSTFTGGAAISAGSTLSASTLKVGVGTSSALGTGQILVKGGTFKYTGNSATTSQTLVHDPRFVNTFEVTTPGQTLTVSTFNNINAQASSVPNGVTLGGAGNLVMAATVKDSTNGTKTPTALSKFGPGSLTLQGTNNTYTGPTSVSGGTFILSSAASINSSASVSVDTGATFTHNSSTSVTPAMTLIEGAVINGSGTFAPGSLSITGDLSGASFTTFALGGASLVKSGSLLLTLSGVTEGTYTLFSGGTVSGAFGTISVGGVPLASTGSGNFAGSVDGASYTFTNAGNQLAVIVPEPTIGTMLAFSAASLLTLRRRRQP